MRRLGSRQFGTGPALREYSDLLLLMPTDHFSIFFAAYYLYRFTAAAWAFRAKNPWIGYRHLWAVVAVDNVYRLITPYVVLTLGVEGWLTRDDSGGEK